MNKVAISLFLILLAPALITSVHAQDYAPASSGSGTAQPSLGELQIHPEVYRGQEIMLGGQVISVRQDGDTTQLEIMQLPLGEKGASQSGPEKNVPEANPALTQGRFLAFQKSGLSPTAIESGALVTVVGIMVGSAVADPNQTSVLYPVLELKVLTVWRQAAAVQAPPPAVSQPNYPMQPPYPPQEPPLWDQPPIGNNFYYTPYWDPALTVWYWRPFWVYPWWARTVVVVPPRIAIVRPHAVPFGRAPRFGPRSHDRLPSYIVPPIGHSSVFPAPAPRSAPYIVPPVGHSRIFPAPGPRIGQPSLRSAPYIVPPIGQPHAGAQRQSRSGRSHGYQQSKGSPRR
jgi:outer membrane lipoprotein